MEISNDPKKKSFLIKRNLLLELQIKCCPSGWERNQVYVQGKTAETEKCKQKSFNELNLYNSSNIP